MQYFDDIVIGQGIAGTAVAWHLLNRGARVLVIDRAESVTSSKIAAGLMTPITGRYLKRTWKWDRLWDHARTFYRQIEIQTETHFFDELSTVRIFINPDEVNAIPGTWADSTIRLGEPAPPLDVNHFDSPFGAFEMRPAGRLNVPSYLAVSAKHFASQDAYRIADLQVETDVRINSERVEIPRLNASASRLTFCQGFAAHENPWFRDVRFDASQGEILTVRIPGLTEQRVVRRGVWLVPLGGEMFKVGSTFDRNQLDGRTHPERLDEIFRNLQSFMKLPFSVVDDAAAVRPNLVGRHPVIGRHSEFPQLAFFNGLGSKGTLQAPYFAEQLTGILLDNQTPEAEVDVIARFASLQERSGLPKPLTQLAHDIVRKEIAEGDIVIDATAGNGYDTRFLARTVGDSGRVYAFDIQPDAITRTALRIADAGVANVFLLKHPHERMAELIHAGDDNKIAAVMFNLGYLPGGDKTVTTLPETTGEAILAATKMLRAGGVITILVYTGHDGGRDEAGVVDSVLRALPTDRFEVYQHRAPVDRPVAPILYVCRSTSTPTSSADQDNESRRVGT